MSTPAQPEHAPAEPSTQPATPPATSGSPAPTPPEPTATPVVPTPEQQPEPKQTDEPKGKSPKFEGEFDPAKFERLVENIRGDVADEKSKREAAEAQVKKVQQDQADFMKKMASLFGVQTDEEKPPTLEELAKQLEESRGETKESRDETRQTRVELAVYRSAAKHGGDPEALLDSRAFANAVAKLDPTGGDFNSQVEKAITDAVEANSKLKAKQPEPKGSQPTPAGGAPMDGAPGSKRQLGKADVARMTPAEITKAVAEGRLNAYLGSG
jgi:hypothetical protein